MSSSRAVSLIFCFAVGSGVALQTMSAADGPESKAPVDPDLNELLLRTLPLADEPTVTGELVPVEQLKGELLPKLREKLRLAYPVRSLEERLAFETAGRKQLAKTLSPVNIDVESGSLSTPAVHAVQELDSSVSWITDSLLQYGSWSRAKVLITVHVRKVDDFVGADGFGVRRMKPPTRQRDWRSTKDRVPFEKTPGWSEADAGDKVDLPGSSSAVPEDAADFFNGTERPTLPAIGGLDSMNRAAVLQFANPESWGMITKRKHAAGFLAHNFLEAPAVVDRARYQPTNDPDKPKLVERWAIRKLQLVGLLRHGEPTVYLTESFPAMDDVKAAKTRPTDEFEAKGLKELAKGKEVAAEATTNRIRMIGAIRMATACTQCHEGNRGDLLGAFSYELVRDPAFVKGDKE